jgi:hypothetical protein
MCCQKVVFFVLLLLVSLSSYAYDQISEGGMHLGITGSAASTDVDVGLLSFDGKHFLLEANAMYFIDDEIAVGVDASTAQIFASGYERGGYSANGILRYYRDWKNFNPFVGVSGGLGFFHYPRDDERLHWNITLFTEVGMNIFLNRNIAFEPSLRYQWSLINFDGDDPYTWNVFGMFLGLRYFMH